MSSPVFSLPPYRVGPYTMRNVETARCDFTDKRRVAEHDWALGVHRLAPNQTQRQLLVRVMRSLVTSIHLRSGLEDRCGEESYTHSLATGLVELPRNSPDFWVAFQQVLEDELCPGAGWSRTAAGRPIAAAHKRPQQVVLDDRVCTLTWTPSAQWKHPRLYGWYLRKCGALEVKVDHDGMHLALIAIHEILHWLHECVGLKDSTPWSQCAEIQAHTLMRLVQQNPEFWAWWLHTVNPRTEARSLAAAAA